MDRKIVFLTLAGALIIVSAALLVQTNDRDYQIEQQRQLGIPAATVEFSGEPIKIGIIHSLTGTMAISETSVVDATLLAIREINEKGGVLGRELVPIVTDGRSDWETFAVNAEKLIVEDKVDVVFGGWTSASRKTMKPVFEKYDHLLFYPVQYEGLESSPNIVYTGAAPNQQVIPAVEWAHENIGNRFFLVGSDYVFPRSANEIIKAKISEIGGEVVGEEYKILGSEDFADVVQKIKLAEPDVILNTINGDSNLAFFAELRKQGITPGTIPTISFSIAEDEIRYLGTQNMAGEYAAWNYFQSIDSPENEKFVELFRSAYGPHRVTDDPMEAAYVGVHLYAKAVQDAGTTDIEAVKESLRGMTINAPEGVVGIDPRTQHLAKTFRIGVIQPDGQFRIVYSTQEAIQPQPYPHYKSIEEWDEFLEGMYLGWGGSWSRQ